LTTTEEEEVTVVETAVVEMVAEATAVVTTVVVTAAEIVGKKYKAAFKPLFLCIILSCSKINWLYVDLFLEQDNFFPETFLW
jgi:hypothetical protein